MEIFVSVLGSRSLSQSALIARCLYSTFEVGGASHRAATVEAKDVPFTVAGNAGSVPLVVTLRNGQTQTVMYVRHIPLSIVATSHEPVTMWVAMYAPGDPRDQDFGEDGHGALRPEVPQIQLSIRRAPSQEAPVAVELNLDELRHTRERLEEELAHTRRRAAALLGGDSGKVGSASAAELTGAAYPLLPEASSLERKESFGLRETERQAQDIKSKVSAMANAQRVAQATEQQLQDFLREIDDARCRVAEAEEELQAVAAARNAVEREKQQARDACNRARDTLRLRDVAVLELRNVRDQTDHQLSEALSDRERHRTDMESSMQRFDAEVRGMSADLDRWRTEAAGLSEAMQRYDRRVLELREQADKASATDPDGGSAELATLRQQLEEATADLDGVMESREHARRQLEELQASVKEAQMQLAQREKQAASNRQQLRAEVGAAEREVVVQIGRAAQLEGQVNENKNQARDLEAFIVELVGQVEKQKQSSQELEATLAVTRRELGGVEAEGEQERERCAVLEERLRQVKEDLEECQRRSEEFDAALREADLESTRQIGELDTTRRSVSSELGGACAEVARLEGVKVQLERQVQEVEAEIKVCEEALDEARRGDESVGQELEAIGADCTRRRAAGDEVASQLMDAEAELELARKELCASEAEAAQIRMFRLVQQHRHQLADVRDAAEARRLDVEAKRALVDETRRSLACLGEENARHQELRDSLDASRAHWRQQAGAAQTALAAINEQRRSVADELSEFKTRHEKALLQRKALAVACEETSARLAAARRSQENARGRSEGQLQNAAIELRLLESEGRIASAQLADDSASVLRLKGEVARLRSERVLNEELVLEYRKALPEVKAALAHCTQLHERSRESEANAAKVRELRNECQAAAETLRKNRDEHGLALGSRDAELERSRRDVSGTLAEKNAELDRRIERIDALEREVMDLSGRVDCMIDERSALSQRRDAKDASRAAAEARVKDQLARLKDLKQKGPASGRFSSAAVDLSALTERHKSRAAALQREFTAHENLRAETASLCNRLEAMVKQNSERWEAMDRRLHEKLQLKSLIEGELCDVEQDIRIEEPDQQAVAEAPEEERKTLQDIEDQMKRLGSGAATEEQKVHLLQEQILECKDSLARAQADARDVEQANMALRAERDEFRDRLVAFDGKLSYQAEHGSLQFSSIEQLGREIASLEVEAEVLTLGLHDADQRSEFLQKENYLMRQQVEGIYKGSIQDWAMELHRVKVAAEIERSRDELSHWQQVAEEIDRDMRMDIQAAKQRHDEAEGKLRQKLDELPEALQRYESRIDDLRKRLPETLTNVQAVPPSLHGLLALPKRLAAANAARGAKGAKQRALVVGCNCSRSHTKLRGCANDAWNMQCLLRHSLQYREEQVRCLVDSSPSCPSPQRSQPTRANILEGLQWLLSTARPGDNLLFYFSGFSTKQPRGTMNGPLEPCLVPQDVVDDFPPDFLTAGRSASAGPPEAGTGYRLVTLTRLRNMIAQLPKGCKMTVVLDTSFAVMPGITSIVEPSPVQVVPVQVCAADAVPHATPEELGCRSRTLELPLQCLGPAPPHASGLPPLACCCHCYTSCTGDASSMEVCIEGVVQGAFTWAFVKALTACHLEATTQQHRKALQGIIGDLRNHFHWLSQTPVLQLGGSAALGDVVVIA